MVKEGENNNNLQGELDDMLKALDSESVPTTNTTTAPNTSSPTTSAATSAPNTTVPTTVGATTQGAATTAVPDERDSELARLRAENEVLKSGKTGAATSAPTTAPPVEPHRFLSDEEAEDLLNNPTKINEVLNAIYQKSLTDAKAIIQQGLSGLPQQIDQQIALAKTLETSRETFYKDNEDLLPFQKVVAVVFGELSEKSPNKSYDEIMVDVAIDTRKRLGLKAKPPRKNTPDEGDKNKQTGKRNAPGLPGKKGRAGRAGKQNTNDDPVQSDIENMNRSLEGT